jgi:hypothetical protein
MENMTIRFVDAFRFRRMNDYDKSKVNTMTTFSEQRLGKKEKADEEDFGIGQKEKDKE